MNRILAARPGTVEVFFQWKKHKKQDIMTFRDHGYRSVMTGTMSPPHHTRWKEQLDDSLESYLQVDVAAE